MNFRNVRIWIGIDNTSSILERNWRCHIRYVHTSNRFTGQIWQWAENKRTVLLVLYIPCGSNVVGDKLPNPEYQHRRGI